MGPQFIGVATAETIHTDRLRHRVAGKELDPFALEESQGKEFDEIGEFFEDEICGLYGCEDVIRKWIIDNRNLF